MAHFIWYQMIFIHSFLHFFNFDSYENENLIPIPIFSHNPNSVKVWIFKVCMHPA